MMYRFCLAASIVFMAISCQRNEENVMDGYEALPNNKAGEIIRLAIDRAGGWESWKNKENFSFFKKITHLDSTGAVERSVRQHHTYNLKGGFKARMEWKADDDTYLIVNNGEQAKKYENGEELTDHRSKNEAWNSSFGSHYVIGMPYKLTDPGVTLTYEGIDTVVLERPVHSVKVEYAEGAGSTGGMHQWWYYFETDTYDLAGNYLDYGEGHSFTSYEVFETVKGHRIHNKRYSYLSNESRERVMLRTIYENEEMDFDQSLDKNAFKLL